MNPKLTVIICTYNREHLLSETIPSVFQQNVSKDSYQVLIVNNNSTDDTANILDDFIKQYKNLIVINESQQGLSFARNTGYKNSTTEWIIYLDDDAKVPINFIEKSLQIIYSKNYDCFGGIYFPWYKYGKPKWFKDIYVSTADYFKNNCGHKLQYASGGIMAIKKSILDKYDGFSTKLGMSGNAVAYGEETLLQRQMEQDGYKIGIVPEWSMEHLVNKYKLKPSWFIEHGYATGRDAILSYDENVTSKKIFQYAIHLFRDLFKNLTGNTPKLFRKKYYWQNWVVETLQPVSLQFGRILGTYRQVFSRQNSE